MSKLSTKPIAPVIYFSNAGEFRAWLELHVRDQEGVWLKIAKKDSGIPSLNSDEAVEVGLCFGWVSGQRKPLDAVYYLQKYVPRRPRSLWSQVNVDNVERLLAAGEMQPTGLAEVEAAKKDGRWAAAYASQRDARIPPDLATALAQSQRATVAYKQLGKSEQYGLILKLLTARSAAVRSAQLQKILLKLLN